MTDDATSPDDAEGLFLPIKSIDPNDDLEDRLTDNALYNIGPARYFLGDEAWDDVFERVAKNVAIAEAVFHSTPIDIGPEQLADWVDEETVDELFEIKARDSPFKGCTQVKPGADSYSFEGAPRTRLDEEIAPYVDYDALLERAPDDIVLAMEIKREAFESAMREQRFIPNSPTLMNAGTELQQLSACFVTEPGDALTGVEVDDHRRASIMQAVEDAADIFKSGGGNGYPFHHLRPKGGHIASTEGVSSGPLSFMKLFDTACETIKQGGCVATDERVMTEQGYVPMGRVYDGPPLGAHPTDERIYTRGGDFDAVIESSDSGRLPTVTVKTESGYDLTVTENHPLLTLDEGKLQFKPAGDLDRADTVVLSAADKRPPKRASLEPVSEDQHHNANVPTDLPEKMTNDLAMFLGIVWGDGCVTYDSTGKAGDRVVIALGNSGNGDKNAQEFLSSFLDEHGIPYQATDKSSTGKGDYTRYQISSSPFVEWLDQNELAKDSDRLEDIPEVLYQSPAAIPAFLGGLTVDGSIHSDASTVRYSTASEAFASTIQDLLLVCGIPAKIEQTNADEDKYSDHPMRTVRVFPGKWARAYDEKVPHLLNGEIGVTDGQRQNQITDPDVYERILDENFIKNNKLPEDADRAAMKDLRRYARGERFASLSRAREMFEAAGVDVSEYDVLDEENLFEQVETVVDSGPTEVCDIENKTGDPEFVTSNFVVHNRRRGAQMAIMHCQHPDIGRFCVSKRGEENFTNFNISIGVTDDFIEAVKADADYTLFDPTSGWINPEAFEIVAETAHFYDPQFEDAWNDEYDKPAVGLGGKVVEENFWRDYVDEMQDPEAFEAYRDRIDLEVGDPMVLPAGFIWQLLVDGAHNKGEPGIFSFDVTNREHSFDVEEHPEHIIHATNPCVTGDSLISTSNGLQRAEDLYKAGIANGIVVDSRLSKEKIKEASSVFKTGVKDVVRVVTGRGYELRVTKDHRIMTDNGWVEAGDLDKGDSIHIQDRKGEFGSHGSEELGRVLGWLVGDGYLRHDRNCAVLSFFDEDAELAESFADDAREVVRDPMGNGDYEIGGYDVNRNNGSTLVEKRVESQRLYELAEDAGLTEEKLSVPEWIFKGSEEIACGFLSALFTADGQVSGAKENGLSVRLTSVSTDLLKEVQKLLLNFGIASTIYEERHGALTKEMPDGRGGMAEYDTQACHDLCISKDNLVQFAEEIGFCNDKQDALEAELDQYTKGPYGEDFTADVVNVIDDGTEAVYDLTEPNTSSFIADGGVVHNCGEQGLENYEACNLGHVNLSLMVDEDAVPFAQWLGADDPAMAEDAPQKAIIEYLDDALDTELLRETIVMGTTFLDNVVTMSKFPLDAIEDQVHGKRKIGLGLMGFHQMLLQMGIQYGTEVSYEVAREIMRRIDKISTDRSHTLALKRGPFEEYAESKWADPQAYPEWFAKHTHQDPGDWPDGYVVRNHNLTTIAPTGTTGMIANTTGGCEPIYNVAYYKNVSDDVQGDEMLVEFDDYFLEVLEANGISPDAVRKEASEMMSNDEFDGVDNLDTVPTEIADLFVTAEELTVDQHIRAQAAFQEYCDSSISKTLNIANSATLEDVGDALELAIDLGIKGATIYRVGSRETEVLTTSSSGGGTTIAGATTDQLLEELLDRIADDRELRAEVMGQLDVVNTSVIVEDRAPVSDD